MYYNREGEEEREQNTSKYITNQNASFSKSDGTNKWIPHKSGICRLLFTPSHASNRDSQVWQMDMRRKLPLTTAHRARQHEAVAHQPAMQADWKPPQLSQLHWPLSAVLQARPNPNMWEWWHQPHDSSKVAKHALVFPQAASNQECNNVTKTWGLTAKPLTPRLKRWNSTFSVIIASASNCSAIASEKHRMPITCGNLGVFHTLIQRWNIAFLEKILSASNCTAITSEKHCMVLTTCRNLRVCHTLIQRWNVACSVDISSAGDCTAITSEKNCVVLTTSRNLGVCQTLIQLWNVACSVSIMSASNCTAITAEKHRMPTTCGNLGVCHTLIQRWNVAYSVIVHSQSSCLDGTSFTLPHRL